MFNPFARVDYMCDSVWQAEDAWYRIAEPLPGIDYSGLREFADERYAELERVNERLDEKGQWTFGIAVASAGAAMAWHEKLGLTPTGVLPGIALLLISSWIAMRARMPGKRPSPFEIRGAMALLEQDERLDFWRCASLQCVVTGLRIVNGWKARQVEFAAGALIAGIALLALFAVGPQLILWGKAAGSFLAAVPWMAALSESLFVQGGSLP